jgi:hypothetical protein
MWTYYITIIVNLLHASVTFCGHLHEGVFTKDVHYKHNQTDVQMQNILVIVWVFW